MLYVAAQKPVRPPLTNWDVEMYSFIIEQDHDNQEYHKLHRKKKHVDNSEQKDEQDDNTSTDLSTQDDDDDGDGDNNNNIDDKNKAVAAADENKSEEEEASDAVGIDFNNLSKSAAAATLSTDEFNETTGVSFRGRSGLPAATLQNNTNNTFAAPQTSPRSARISHVGAVAIQQIRSTRLAAVPQFLAIDREGGLSDDEEEDDPEEEDDDEED